MIIGSGWWERTRGHAGARGLPTGAAGEGCSQGAGGSLGEAK